MTTAKPTNKPAILFENIHPKKYQDEKRFVIECETDFPGIKNAIASCGYRPNAVLIAEAFTLLNETSLTPRQLDDQRRELFEVLKFACSPEKVGEALGKLKLSDTIKGHLRREIWEPELTKLTKAKGQAC